MSPEKILTSLLFKDKVMVSSLQVNSHQEQVNNLPLSPKPQKHSLLMIVPAEKSIRAEF
jgi:hypothetical protein